MGMFATSRWKGGSAPHILKVESFVLTFLSFFRTLVIFLTFYFILSCECWRSEDSLCNSGRVVYFEQWNWLCVCRIEINLRLSNRSFAKRAQRAFQCCKLESKYFQMTK